MSKKWITLLVAAVIGALLLPSAAMAVCVTTVANSLTIHDSTAAASVTDPVPYTAGDKVDGITVTGTAALTVNKEGVIERVADLLISDDGVAPNCFASGNDLIITYNAIMTLPTTPGNLAVPGNLDIFDSNGIAGLTITSATITSVFAANTTNSQLDIKVGQAGTVGTGLTTGANGQTGAAIRIKNIRMNASAASGTIAATFLGNTYNVGTRTATVIAANNIYALATGPSAIVAGGVGGGVQSSNAGLAAPNSVATQEGFGNSMRTKGGTCNSSTLANDTCYSQVANDIATSATSMTFSVTGIPSGVTVTFPSSMSTSAVDGADGLTITNRSGSTLTNSGAPGAVTVTYDTAANTAALQNTLVVETADNPDVGTNIGTTTATSNPNCKISGSPAVLGNLNNGSLCDTNPKIGVKVGTTSLSGTANLWWVFGPADAGSTPQFTGEDVAADTTVIPRYTGSARTIVKNKAFFTIFPTRTTLLFPFVSTRGGWNSGIEVANTGNDAGVFATTASSQLGGVTLFFFGDNPNSCTGSVCTPVVDSVNSDLTAAVHTDLSSACLGLDGTGRVAAGATAACAIDKLLPLLPTKPTGFEGYVIAVTGFNFGHGFSVVFNASGAPFAAQNALVLGLNGATARVGTEGLGQ